MKPILLSLVLFFFSVHIFAQNNLLQELIDLPAPPSVAKTENESGEKRPRSEEFYDKKNVPPDNAPIEDLLDFWKRQNFITASHPNKIEPSAKTLLRLIKSLEDQPENLNNFLTLLPVNDEVTAIAKKIFDTQGANFDESWRESVKKWLKYKSPYFSEELFTEAQNAKDHKTYNSVTKEEELRALAKIDWKKAESLLERLESDKNNPRTAFFAKRLIYEHAIEEKDSAKIEKYRNEFKKIVENKSASGYERDDALDALLQNEEWQGQDDWYLSLFEDETLLLLRLSENTVSSPLSVPARKNPDKWIPLLTQLVGNKNRNIHNAAVNGLIDIADDKPRRDALLPLIPLLMNSEWADISGQNWIGLVQWMGMVDLPESIPSLIYLLETEEGTWRGWTARALARYKDSRAIPALKLALEKEAEEGSRKDIIDALVVCGGLTDDEQMSALESYVVEISKPDGYARVESRNEYEDENPLPVSVSIGKYLANLKDPGEDLIRLLIERQKILQKEKPEIAKILSQIMSKWQGRLVDLEMLGRITDGQADAATIVGALARRKELRERVSGELYALRGKSGLAGAMAACLIEDENDIVSAFHNENIEMQIGTLACARLLRKPLPVREVGALLDSTNKLLTLAAERYLESEDGLEARQLVLAKHKGEAMILGARTSFNPAKKSESSPMLGSLFASVNDSYGNYLHPETADFTELDKFEDKLRAEIKANSDLLEIYTIVPSYVVRIYKDRAVLTWYEDKARYRETTLKKQELEDLQRFVAESKLEDSPPVFGNCHYNCGRFEFVRFNRNGGRRFFAYTNFTAFIGFWTKFQNLSESEGAKRRYYLQDKIDGLEILLAGNQLQPQAIWKNGDDFRVLVADEARKTEIENEIQKQDKIDDDNEDSDYEIRGKNARQRRLERAFEHYEWREFKDGKPGTKVGEPIEIPFLRDQLIFPAVQNLRSNDSVWQSKSGNYEIRAGEYNQGSLWKVNRSEQIEFKKGVYSNPIVGGNYLVAAKADVDWSAPNYVVRINLQTGKELKIKLPPAEEFYPIAFVPAHRKFLLYRAKEAYSTLNPIVAEYYLLDADTGRTEAVKGEFQPLITPSFRPLQPTGKPNEFWATVYSRAKNETDIGVFNTQNFTFKSLLKLPEILLNSMEIWVDEKKSKIYFIYKGDYGRETHLLSLPFPGEEK